MITNYFLTKTIAGNEFLTLNKGSYNLNCLTCARLWHRDSEDENFLRIVLEFSEKVIYLSHEGDDHHTSGNIWYNHYEMSPEAFQKALEFFGLDEESKPQCHGSYK